MREEILAKIHANKSPAKINLANMQITDDEIQEIMDVIKQLKPETSKIDLDNNNIGDKGAIILSENLCYFDHINELSMQFNDIDKKGALYLFGLKKIFSNIDILFHGNKIIDVGEMAEIERMAEGKSFKL